MDNTDLLMAWFVKNSSDETKGPVTEAQLRTWLESNESHGGQVRQDTSAWHPAESVKERFDQLRNSGIYLRGDGGVTGPFTTTRADRLVAESGDKFTSRREGLTGEWLLIADSNSAASNKPHSLNHHEPPEIAPNDAFAVFVRSCVSWVKRLAILDTTIPQNPPLPPYAHATVNNRREPRPQVQNGVESDSDSTNLGAQTPTPKPISKAGCVVGVVGVIAKLFCCGVLSTLIPSTPSKPYRSYEELKEENPVLWTPEERKRMEDFNRKMFERLLR